eukprot:2125743-Rhodomonas_salina.1
MSTVLSRFCQAVARIGQIHVRQHNCTRVPPSRVLLLCTVILGRKAQTARPTPGPRTTPPEEHQNRHFSDLWCVSAVGGEKKECRVDRWRDRNAQWQAALAV